MKSFKVINWDFNSDSSEEYDVIPYFVNCYEEAKEGKLYLYDKVPETFEEFKEFVRRASQYRFWGRCEYEIIITGLLQRNNSEKWDIHHQVLMNLDTITRLVMESL